MLESRREFAHHEIIELLVKTGKPVVMACDTANTPSTVDNIASSMGATRFTPEEDLSRRRKKKLGEGNNSHEMDATASARYAFNNLKRSIEKVSAEAETSNQPIDEIASSYFGTKTRIT